MAALIRADGGLLSSITWDEDESPEDRSYSYEDFGALTQSTKFLTGTGDGQINDVYHDDLTIPAGETWIVRLDVIPVILFNRPYTKSFQRLNALQVHNLSLISEVFIDQSIPDALDFLPLSARINPGGVYQLEGQYDIVLPADGIGLRNPSTGPLTLHITVLGVFDA